jgi:transposase-like protein
LKYPLCIFLQDVLDSSSAENLKNLFKEKKITLYMASEYRRLKNKILGISWDKRAIMYQSDRYKMLSFPKASPEWMHDALGLLFSKEK